MTTGDPLDTPFFHTLNLIQQQYPQFLPFLSQPGVFQILSQAIDPATADQWSPERIQAAIQQLPWYTQNDAGTRKLQLLSAVDPATAHTMVSDARFTINQLVGQLGVDVDPTSLLLLSLNAAAQGWNTDRIRAELLAMTNAGGFNLHPGLIGALSTQLGQDAAQYGVAVDGGGRNFWATNILAGNTTEDAWKNYLQQQAMGLFPAIAKQLGDGLTVAQVAAPYLAMASKEIGVDPTMMDLTDPKWTNLFIAHDANGQQVVRNQLDALATIRGDPRYGYDTSINGRQSASQLTTQLGQMMGALG